MSRVEEDTGSRTNRSMLKKKGCNKYIHLIIKIWPTTQPRIERDRIILHDHCK